MTLKQIADDYKNIITQKFFCFDGRAGRKEFWMFVLITYIIFLILYCIPFLGWILAAILQVLLILPILGLTARRLHDTNKTGWLQLIMIIPLIGHIVLLILMLLPSDVGANKYGEPVTAAPVKDVKADEADKAE